VAGQGPGDHQKRRGMLFPELLQQIPNLSREALFEETTLDPGQCPSKMVPKPLEATANIFNGRPMDATIQRAHQGHPEAGDHMLDQEQGLGSGARGFRQGAFQEGFQAAGLLQRPAGGFLQGMV